MLQRVLPAKRFESQTRLEPLLRDRCSNTPSDCVFQSIANYCCCGPFCPKRVYHSKGALPRGGIYYKFNRVCLGCLANQKAVAVSRVLSGFPRGNSGKSQKNWWNNISRIATGKANLPRTLGRHCPGPCPHGFFWSGQLQPSRVFMSKKGISHEIGSQIARWCATNAFK